MTVAGTTAHDEKLAHRARKNSGRHRDLNSILSGLGSVMGGYGNMVSSQRQGQQTQNLADILTAPNATPQNLSQIAARGTMTGPQGSYGVKPQEQTGLAKFAGALPGSGDPNQLTPRSRIQLMQHAQGMRANQAAEARDTIDLQGKLLTQQRTAQQVEKERTRVLGEEQATAVLNEGMNIEDKFAAREYVREKVKHPWKRHEVDPVTESLSQVLKHHGVHREQLDEQQATLQKQYDTSLTDMRSLVLRLKSLKKETPLDRFHALADAAETLEFFVGEEDVKTTLQSEIEDAKARKVAGGSDDEAMQAADTLTKQLMVATGRRQMQLAAQLGSGREGLFEPALPLGILRSGKALLSDRASGTAAQDFLRELNSSKLAPGANALAESFFDMSLKDLIGMKENAWLFSVAPEADQFIQAVLGIEPGIMEQ